MPATKKQTSKTATPVAPATPAKPFSAGMKLERLSVREKIKAALNLPKEAITSREAGHIDIVVAASMFTAQALTSAVLAACSSNGIQCSIISPATQEGETVKLSLTNDLMIKQGATGNGGLGWGARGNARQSRVLLEAASQPKAVTATVSQPEAKAAKVKKIKTAK